VYHPVTARDIWGQYDKALINAYLEAGRRGREIFERTPPHAKGRFLLCNNHPVPHSRDKDNNIL
jgi:hypothetical protein